MFSNLLTKKHDLLQLADVNKKAISQAIPCRQKQYNDISTFHQ